MKNSSVVCSECGKKVDREKVCIIDNKPVCHKCLFGDTRPVMIYPIGKVRTEVPPGEKQDIPRPVEGISCIDLLPSQKQFMYRLEEEKYLTIVYYLHKVTSVRSVFNRRMDGKKVGVFASRTPYRLSKIAIQDVRLLKIEDTKLYVDGLDAIEESPVLDIKIKVSALDLPPKKQHNEIITERM